MLTVMEYLLVAIAWFGHACLSMGLVNFVYAHPLHKHFLKVFRAVMGLLIVAGPLVYLWQFGFNVTGLRYEARETPPLWLLVAYLVGCLGAGGIIFPVVTLHRLTRRRPAAVLDETTRTIDVAKELGHPPIGDGETAFMARFPFNDIFRVDFTTLILAIPDVPTAWDGLTLLHISDLHFLGTPSRAYYDAIFRHCLAEGIPDLLLLTGDFVDTDTHHSWIAPVLGQLSWNIGAFAILGNHDWWQDHERVRHCLREIGMRVVSNRWEQIDVRGEKLTVIGHEGPWFRTPPDMTGCPAEGIRLLLSHTPDNIKWARRHNVSLMLAGHVHGGQVRLPLVGSIFVPSRFGRRYDMGTFFEPPTLLHVNRGLSGKEPLRFRCNPQVTRIVLQRPADAASR
jgi:predicted MPP superfamily phosphohydrolase